MILPALLLSCAHAGAERKGVFEAPGAFRIGAPGDGWELHRNRRVGHRLLVDWKKTGEDVDVRVTVHPLDPDERRLPLAVLAQALVMNWGRSQGLATDVDAIARADFGEHEGIVVFARRYWPDGGAEKTTVAVEHPDTGDDTFQMSTLPTPTPVKAVEAGLQAIAAPTGTPAAQTLQKILATKKNPPLVRIAAANSLDTLPVPSAPQVDWKVQRRFAQAFVRAGDHLLMITYMAPPDSFDLYSPVVAAMIERLAIAWPPDPPEMGLVLPSDLPQKDPSGEPGPLPLTTPRP